MLFRSLRTLVLFNLVFLLVYGFVIDEKPYLYAADVSPDGTKIAFSSMEEGKLWCYCLIRELSTVMIADGNICLRCLGFKVTEFPLEELRSAKLIFKNGQCSRVYLSVHEETDLRRALRTANRRGGKSIQFAATTKRLEQLTKQVLLQQIGRAHV